MSDRRKQKIMVVDDDPAIRESMTAFLHANGYELSSATDGYDALWLLKNGLVDIVISDLEMPGLSGFEFLSILRQRYPETSVIAMTGRPEGRSKLATAIADAFYPKGQQHPKRLLSMIAELLRDSTIRTRVQEAESSAVRITDNRSDTGSTPDVLVTSPECLKSFSIEAQRESASTEAREVPCAFCGDKLGEVIAFSNFAKSTGHAGSTKPRYGFGMGNVCASTRKFASVMHRKCRDLWCWLANRRLLDESPARPSSREPSDHEHTKHSKFATQSSSAVDREGRCRHAGSS